MPNVRQLVYNLFQRMGWEVRRNSYSTNEQVLLERFLGLVRPNAVVDVGANLGQYASLVRRSGFAGRIVSFEAQPEVHAELVVKASQDAQWVVAPCCALGRASGQAEIRIAGNSLSSSLLPMLDVHLQAAPESRYVGSQQIRLATLDELAPQLLPSTAKLFLKIDTQGYEEEVLLGASATLNRVCAMQLEMSVVPLYAGAPSMRRLLELTEAFHFGLYGLMPGFYDQRSGRLLQVDGLFIREH